ncbi:PREDICTED: GDP-fucose protein O-fucosyltransferase 1-like [Priapulus caudatus]|uniref:GDP-fucose protein O-fucosyltransferase 1 n=1 Tax=Priapulus caudatus TaxID=37621 RepID=A0ABM1DRC4_PRICU|nr:PREDICTED: GDP-fucose protein O-fucosyltransferase 1-like [Priapulus caudatus]
MISVISMPCVNMAVCLNKLFNPFSTCLMFILIVHSSTTNNNISDSQIDSNGYVAYCPCMGRFGNQADHFLGSLAFAHGLDRTLILPPWIEYHHDRSSRVEMVPFDTYFKVEALQEYHRVITMEKFMKLFAARVWPVGQRKSLCYMARKFNDDMIDNDCNAKDGNPFGPFWDNFGINFVSSEFHQPLFFNTQDVHILDAWQEKFPAATHPVLAFTGAPASFPVTEENRHLHRYLQWSKKFDKESDVFIEENFPNRTFVGIHLRNGIDWKNACEHINMSPSLFAAPQCLGYRRENGDSYAELCAPPRHIILTQVKKALKKMRTGNLFVATDVDAMVHDFRKELRAIKGLKVVRGHADSPHLDLAVLAKSTYYIGNCISSFSAFPKRERDVAGRPSAFWAFPKHEYVTPEKDLHLQVISEHDEL